MKTVFFFGLVLSFFTGSLLSAASAQADAVQGGQPCEEEKTFDLDASLGIYTSYMWRGLRLYDGASLQPSLTAAYDTGFGTMSATGWMHISGDSDKQSERFTEFDGTLKYAYELDPVVLSVGHIWYAYSEYGDGTDIPETAEFFASAALNWDAVTPSLTVYEDYREYHNHFYELAFSHEFTEAFGTQAAVTPFASFGFASRAEKVYESNGFEEATVGVSTSVPCGPLSLQPVINYTFKVDKLTSNQLWAGFNLAYSF